MFVKSVYEMIIVLALGFVENGLNFLWRPSFPTGLARKTTHKGKSVAVQGRQVKRDFFINFHEDILSHNRLNVKQNLINFNLFSMREKPMAMKAFAPIAPRAA